MNTTPTFRPRAAETRTAEAGFTLVEALCAIVILVFGLMAITNLMLVAASSNTVANQSTAATAAAAQQIEILKRTPWGDPALAPGGDPGGTQPAYCVNPPQVLPGVGQITTCWSITLVDPQTLFLRVRSEGTGALTRARSRAEFTAVRACTDTSNTTPGVPCPAGPPAQP
jgi:Tfp pilus assembly protein PilV